MKPAHAHLYRYAIPFTEPVSVRGMRLALREGLILALEAEGGTRMSYGEIAPLPGLHKETLEEAKRQLEALFFATRANKGTLWLHPDRLHPSVQTGLEMALLNLEAAAHGSTPFSDLPQAEHVPLNALLFGNTETVLARAWEQFTLGYRAFKLKVTASAIQDASASIKALHREFGSTIELRLDANQSMTMEEAIELSRNIPEGSVAYIEEPLKEPGRIGEFHARTGLRSALDESLWMDPGLLSRLPDGSLGALVIKPACIGGISRAMELAQTAAGKGLQAVFSAAFETGVSLGFYALMSACTDPQPPACGLDTYRYLQHDLLIEPFGTDNASLEVAKLYHQSLRPDHAMMNTCSSWTL